MQTDQREELADPEWSNLITEEDTLEESLPQALCRIPIFSLLSDNELELLGRMVHLRTYAPDETVIQRGVEQSGLYVVKTGSVNIVRRSLDGTRTVVGSLGAGEILGEFALLDNTPRTSSVVAAEASVLIGFFKPDLTGILTTKPTMGCKILLRLAEEMCRSLGADYRRLRGMGYPFPPAENLPETLSLGAMQTP